MSAGPAEPDRRTKKTAATKKKAAQKTAPTRKQASPRRAAASRTSSNGSGELRSGPIAGTALVDGVSFQGKGVQYAEVDGMAVFEGDIVLGTVREVEDRAARGSLLESVGVSAVVAGRQLRWPNATVPFEIDPALPNPQRVTDAIAHWQSRTRIRCVERTPANAAQFPDFVRFVPGGGCSSHVGRRGGMQAITLGTNCTTGNTIHEIGHAVGLWHEQSREDRDQHVTIDFTNVAPDMQHNFVQHIADGDDLGPYDFGSVMHYPATAFAIDPNRPTIVPRHPLPEGVVMGQRTGLSQGDIDGVHMMYAGVQPPPTFKEMPKDPIVDTTVKEIPKDPVQDLPHKHPALDTFPFPQPFPQPVGMPFVLATPHQSPALAGQTDGLTEQVRQLSAVIGAMQQELAAVAASHSSLLAQLSGQLSGRLPGGPGQPR
ncbi:M12 family metallopeptidase [Streptomyces sp. APSN-46.1]|uniref:Dot/Icm T4SS effector Zinc-dependent metalloprotease LegP n=1 Tax=Streptomyces sp. APSN-46.1 TaxID=2929049 RepID=UPI001FB47AD1|nr:Dot/Icm T4SS effector Zinc-dependent metalloprotease LegP [Streptomyces sp. APSN-46.1]MCJ1676458.1 M12 family metallopeptidase [Streptomyces sp. APSN-46.1]